MQAATAPAATSVPQMRRLSISIPAWLGLVGLLILGVVVRLPHLAIDGSPGDSRLSLGWGFASRYDNFRLYASTDINHPPLFPVLNGLTHTLVDLPELRPLIDRLGITDIVRLKFFPVLAELILIATAYLWLRGRGWLRVILPLALTIHPGMIINSALWGQSDPLIGLFLTLALIMLNRAKPGLAWVFFGIALLTKFQSIALLPLMVIITYRRYPFGTALRSAFTGALTWGIGMLSYVIVSGMDKALHPYAVGSVGVFPYTTMFALNFWHLIEPGYWTNSLNGLGFPDDRAYYFAPLTDLQMGFLMLGIYTALICLIMWRQARQPREFVWGAALYFGFFMLPTQIHERYLYPAVVMTIFALAQERRLWVVALGTAWTFTMNLIWSLNAPFVGLGSLLWYFFGIGKVRFAALNAIFFIEQTLIAAFPTTRRFLLIPTRLLAAGVTASLIGLALIPPPAAQTIPFYRLDGFTVENAAAQLIGYRIDWREGGFWLTLYFEPSRPVSTFLIGEVEVMRDGVSLGLVRGAVSDVFEGSWRWLQGQVHWLSYDVPVSGALPPDEIYVSFIDGVTFAPVPMGIGEQAAPVYRYRLEPYADGVTGQ